MKYYFILPKFDLHKFCVVLYPEEYEEPMEMWDELDNFLEGPQIEKVMSKYKIPKKLFI